MRRNWVWLLVTLILINDWFRCCCGCWAEEKNALLEIKAWITRPNSMFSHDMEDWVDNEAEADCCRWHRVKCNPTTRQVMELSLGGAWEDWRLGKLCFNASFFLPFEGLKTLQLGGNGFVGCYENQGFDVLSSRLLKLEELDISLNDFNDSVLSSLSGFSSLKSLDLSGQMLTGSTGVNGLRKLQTLHLNYTNISSGSIFFQSLGALPSLKTFYAIRSNLSNNEDITGLYNLTHLEDLYLDGASLTEKFLGRIGALSALKVLSLRYCELNGTLPAQGWCDLKNLQQLHLRGSNLEGLLPACLGNLSSLQLLDVSDNQLRGNIAYGPVTSLTSLKYLSLSSNQFQIPVSFGSFANHSNLKFISFDNNKLVAEPAFQNFIPKFQLQFLSLLNCSSKASNGEIPKFLYTQYDLRVLDLSHNYFHGKFPSWLLENNSRLEQLLLRDNAFVGPLQLPYHPSPELSRIDISNNNNISGQIPRNICLIFPNLEGLRMAKNGLTGDIPRCFGNMSSLQYLDLSNNHLMSMGILEKLTSLVYFLDFGNNNLGGQISPLVFNSSTLGYLYLDGNNFVGTIPDFSWFEPSLFALDFGNNHLSGMLPRWIGNMTYLEAIDLSKNHFDGPIPEVCKHDFLKFFDVSQNNLSGSIPFCFSPSQISHIHLYKNRLSGQFPYALLANATILVTLDLASNKFSGPIPTWIGNYSYLSVLNLKANHFNGELPVQLCILQQLTILDVSQNKLSGSLPSCLGNLPFTFLFRQFADSGKTFTGGGIFAYQFFNKSNFVSMGLPQVDSYYLYREYVDFISNEVVQFTTKRHSYAYKGDILNFMSGIDLSCNRFTGEIPPAFGNLSEIHALNLSHNNLAGSIPETFSSLKQIESLDLSHNNLTGIIPLQLTQLTALGVFSVAYNNLTGRTPEWKNQFGTFDESSYEGNPYLCGPELQKNCSKTEAPLQPMPNASSCGRKDDGVVDMDVFYLSFGIYYVVTVVTIAAVLYINPHWRRRWFFFIEECINACYHLQILCFITVLYRDISYLGYEKSWATRCNLCRNFC